MSKIDPKLPKSLNDQCDFKSTSATQTFKISTQITFHCGTTARKFKHYANFYIPLYQFTQSNLPKQNKRLRLTLNLEEDPF